MTVNKPSKIVIIGLDNSGKTSILINLKENSNLMSYFSLKPTKGLAIESFENEEQNFVCWDLGGQKQYRDQYLKDFDKYLKETEKIIFVIDVQDIDRYKLALGYLKKIVEILKTKEPHLEFWIFLHKFDPNITKQKNFEDIENIVETSLASKIRDLMPSNLRYNIYKTSIYTIFEKNLY
jgi:small GTP-binding protein